MFLFPQMQNTIEINPLYAIFQETYEHGKPTCFVAALLDYQRKNTEKDFKLDDDDVFALTFDMLNAGRNL